MQTLKEILNQNHSKKNKAELINILTNLSELISMEEYEKVSGIKPIELKGITKKEILSVITDLKENYKPEWEEKIANASTNVIKAIFSQMEADEARFTTQNTDEADFPAELGNIPFSKLISGPLNAAVEAQNSASIATVNFIKEVGFDENNEIRQVDFSYKKTIPNPNLNADPSTLPPGTDTTSPTLKDDVIINVPFLSIVNIPSLRIETVDIDFNVKLNSVLTKQTDTSFGIDGSLRVKYGPVDFKVSASYRRASSTGIKVEKQYTMGVRVTATNDEIPAGLEQVLGLLGA